jgi:hypothetical protein
MRQVSSQDAAAHFLKGHENSNAEKIVSPISHGGRKYGQLGAVEGVGYR